MSFLEKNAGPAPEYKRPALRKAVSKGATSESLAKDVKSDRKWFDINKKQGNRDGMTAFKNSREETEGFRDMLNKDASAKRYAQEARKTALKKRIGGN